MLFRAFRVTAIVVTFGSISISAGITHAATTQSGTANGNYDKTFVPAPGDYLYIDLNRTVNGSGLTANDPSNKLPNQIGDGTQLFFNSDNGVQTIPCRDNSIFVNGSDIQISSYGSGRATVSAYQLFSNGWTRVGSSNVWKRTFSGGNSGAGPVVGNMIDLTRTKESPTGDVLNWYNLEEEGNKIGVFRSNPTVLPTGNYAYDWQQQVMYVNIGADPNSRKLGAACVGRLVNTPIGANPARVSIHGLRLIGFTRESINIAGGSNHWHIYDNILYGNGGMYNVVSKWYFGSGIQMTENTNNIEINNNIIVQTYDSPITPQHFGGATGGHIHDLHIHHNFIDRWALGAVEISDFGTNNRFSRITIEDNTAINGGKGFSRTGDTPQGVTDGIQVRGGDASQFSSLVVRRNKVNGYDSDIVIGGNNFSDDITVQNNTLWGAKYGIWNKRAQNASLAASSNTLCNNNIQIYDKSTGSQYVNNNLVAGACQTDPLALYNQLTGSTDSLVTQTTNTTTTTASSTAASVDCGPPSYNAAKESAVFVWKDCATGMWNVRLTSGASYGRYTGEVLSDQPFAAVTPVSLESTDVLNYSKAGLISYAVEMLTYEDGFNFRSADGANLCFDIASPSGTNVFVGASRTPASVPFDPETLASCSATPKPDVSVGKVTASEADSSADFVVKLSAASTQTVTVDVQSANGTATAGKDYIALKDTLTFQPGETAHTVSVSLINDALIEGQENFTMNLSNATNAQLKQASGTGIIVDDESTACGAPTYDPAKDRGVFVWQDCASGAWHARFTAGTSYSEYVGTVTATQPFDYADGFRLEWDDKFDAMTDARLIDFDLRMKQYDDGFDFSYPANASACFGLSNPTNTQVYVGPHRVQVSLPFNPKTLGSC